MAVDFTQERHPLRFGVVAHPTKVQHIESTMRKCSIEHELEAALFRPIKRLHSDTTCPVLSWLRQLMRSHRREIVRPISMVMHMFFRRLVPVRIDIRDSRRSRGLTCESYGRVVKAKAWPHAHKQEVLALTPQPTACDGSTDGRRCRSQCPAII